MVFFDPPLDADERMLFALLAIAGLPLGYLFGRWIWSLIL